MTLVKIVPNILSVFRICLVPVFVVAYFADDNEIKYFAILVYAIAGLSDFLDGFLARKFKAQSNLGKFLDPLGDKLMTFSVLICITITRPILLWAVIVFFIKEILMGIGGLILHRKVNTELPPANIIGKVSTVVFFVVCATLMLLSELSNSIAITLISIAIGLALVALAGYIVSYIKIMKSVSTKTGAIGEEVKCNQQSVQDVNETLQ
jgi:CDP-diacylglycerol--glycerol-3-phosphate 3-phosphatidyltransferase